jgi:hypothetical protein
MSRLLVSLAAAAAAVALLACVDQGRVPLEPLDDDRYAADVQPYVAVACGTLDCHGDPGRPLRLYSELGLREGDAFRPRALSEALAPEPLSAQELAANVLAFRAVAGAHRAGGEELALSKPLARSAGGAEHVGGDIFDSTDAPGHRCLRAWIGGEPEDGACDEARAELGFE